MPRRPRQAQQHPRSRSLPADHLLPLPRRRAGRPAPHRQKPWPIGDLPASAAARSGLPGRATLLHRLRRDAFRHADRIDRAQSNEQADGLRWKGLRAMRRPRVPPGREFRPERRQDDAHQYPYPAPGCPHLTSVLPAGSRLQNRLAHSDGALSASDHRSRQVLGIACEQNAGDMQKDEDEHYVRSDLVHFFPEFAGSSARS